MAFARHLSRPRPCASRTLRGAQLDHGCLVVDDRPVLGSASAVDRIRPCSIEAERPKRCSSSHLGKSRFAPVLQTAVDVGSDPGTHDEVGLPHPRGTNSILLCPDAQRCPRSAQRTRLIGSRRPTESAWFLRVCGETVTVVRRLHTSYSSSLADREVDDADNKWCRPLCEDDRTVLVPSRWCAAQRSVECPAGPTRVK